LLYDTEENPLCEQAVSVTNSVKDNKAKLYSKRDMKLIYDKQISYVRNQYKLDKNKVEFDRIIIDVLVELGHQAMNQRQLFKNKEFFSLLEERVQQRLNI
jgi:hypothetical protein